MTDHPVSTKIVFIRNTFSKSHFPKQCVADAINDAAFGKVGRAIRIHYNATVNCATHSWYYQFAIFQFDIYYLRSIVFIQKKAATPRCVLGGTVPQFDFSFTSFSTPA